MQDNEISNWISSIIESCNHDFQLECADNLIELFSKRTENSELIDNLRIERNTKFAVIHGF
jgi:hypothetical protein